MNIFFRKFEHTVWHSILLQLWEQVCNSHLPHRDSRSSQSLHQVLGTRATRTRNIPNIPVHCLIFRREVRTTTRSGSSQSPNLKISKIWPQAAIEVVETADSDHPLFLPANFKGMPGIWTRDCCIHSLVLCQWATTSPTQYSQLWISANFSACFSYTVLYSFLFLSLTPCGVTYSANISNTFLRETILTCC